MISRVEVTSWVNRIYVCEESMVIEAAHQLGHRVQLAPFKHLGAVPWIPRLIDCRSIQVSLPMLAPLLLGTGMMLRSIRSNASIIFPRICVLVVLLYVLWFANSVLQNTVVNLRRQVRSCR